MVGAQDAALKLSNGRFALRREALLAEREHFIRWYSEPDWAQRKAWLAEHGIDVEGI